MRGRQSRRADEVPVEPSGEAPAAELDEVPVEPAEVPVEPRRLAAPALRKALGQHHLTRAGVCAPLVDFLRPSGDQVLEIGPGGGVLTGALLEAGARVIGWELDLAWAAELSRRLGRERVGIVVGDALELPWERLPRCSIAGNLPYNVATTIIEGMLVRARAWKRAGFLVQLEVARRLVAGPRDPDYGSLSVLTAARSSATLLGRVRPGAFRPPPKVDSAFVGFEPAEPPFPRDEMPSFARTVRQAFALRRKTLRNSLAKEWGVEEAERVLAALGLSPRTRAEELALLDFVAIHSKHANRARASAGQDAGASGAS